MRTFTAASYAARQAFTSVGAVEPRQAVPTRGAFVDSHCGDAGSIIRRCEIRRRQGLFAHWRMRRACQQSDVQRAWANALARSKRTDATRTGATWGRVSASGGFLRRNVVGDPRSPSFRPPAHLDDVRRGVAPAERSRVVAVDGCGLAEESQNLNRCHPVSRSGELPNCGRVISAYVAGLPV